MRRRCCRSRGASRISRKATSPTCGASRYAIFDAAGKRVERTVVDVQGSSDAVELGPYRHFMQKEIFEQPRAVADTLEGVARIAPALFGAEGRGDAAGRRFAC